MYYSRKQVYDSHDDYMSYLRQIMNNPGWGYILMEWQDDELKVLDFNQEAAREFNIPKATHSKVGEHFASLIDKEDKEKIRELKIARSFRKVVQFYRLNELQFVEFNIRLLSYQKDTFLLARVNNVTQDIRKREELEANERKYRSLYNRNKAGVFTIDQQSTVLNGNAAFLEMFEDTMKVGDKLFPRSIQEEWKFILDVLETKESIQSYQTQFALKNGVQKIFVFSWFFDQKTQNIEGSVIDLTNIQRASQALKQSEEKYRSIYEESYDAIILLDGDTIVDVNRRAIQLFGLTENELKKKTLFSLSIDTGKESQFIFKEQFEKLANLRSTKFEWLFNSNGRVVESEVSLVEIILEDKMFHQCVIHDRTDLNKNMREIERNQRNLEQILESNPEGILIARENSILYTNPEMKNLMGDSVELKDLFKDEHQEQFQRLYEEQSKSSARRNTTLELINKDGEHVLVDVTMVPTIYEEAESTLVIVKDISVQNTLANEKMRAELAEESNKKLADEIVERIKTEKQLQDLFLRTKAILDSSSNTFLLTLTNNKLISTYNRHFLEYFQRQFDIHVEENTHFDELITSIIRPSELRLFNRLFRYVLNGDSRQIEVQLNRANGEVWLEIFMSPIFDTEGIVSEISIVAHDISEKKKSSMEIEESLREKEVLLKEIHHRVKNNLQVISSILNLQSSFVKDKNTLGILQESRNRIRSMAIIHENLYRTEDFSSVNFAEYLQNLTANLIATYRVSDHVELKSDLQAINLTLDQAIPCGLLVNELITNSLKYAWEEGNAGRIDLQLKEIDRTVYLETGDDGRGLPRPFEDMNTDTLGLQLVATLVEQLDGEIKVEVKNGTKYLIKFENIKPLTHAKN